ncbi:uncharacterized protein LOC107019357 [Solanum pennellii]|uniref:Uncharacterized protein LOC107019357 n=1 Tax=Solanum pennellii TaxID=28526 RepID=A0ABM1GSQ0_SOLPN|nr:uncharacterized protein LOC107019357 [Solanum pennellii]
MRVEMQRRQDLPPPGFAANAVDGRLPIYLPSSNMDPTQNQPSTPVQNPSIIDLSTQNPRYASTSYQNPPSFQNNYPQMPPYPQNINLQTAPPPQNQNQNQKQNAFNPQTPHHHLNQNTNPQTYLQNYQTSQNALSPSVAPPLPKRDTFQILVPTEHDVHGSELDHYEEHENEWRAKEDSSYRESPPVHQVQDPLYQNSPPNYQDSSLKYQANPYPKSQDPRPNIRNYQQDLIDQDVVSLQPASPNVNTNPLPKHRDSNVNMIETDEDLCETKMITPIIHDDLERAVSSLSVKEKREFVVLTPAKAVALVPSESLVKPKFVIETIAAQGMTTSGRCYNPGDLALGGQKKDQAKGPIIKGEAEEFKRRMKPKYYSIVKHLEKTPAHISVWALLMSFQSHRQALMKDLDDTYRPADTSSDNVATLIYQVIGGHRINFCEDEMPVEGRSHNKALHIIVVCRKKVVNHVLVDDGSGLSICPLSMLRQLRFDLGKLEKNQVNVRAFNGIQRDTLGAAVHPYGWSRPLYSPSDNEARVEERRAGYSWRGESPWQTGYGLGRDSRGIIEPVPVLVKGSRYGLGYIHTDDDMKYADHEDLKEGICDLFEEIDAVVEEEVELAGIRDAEPGEVLRNWTSTPILIPQTLRDDEVDDYEEESEKLDYVAKEFRQFENQHKPNLEEA